MLQPMLPPLLLSYEPGNVLIMLGLVVLAAWFSRPAAPQTADANVDCKSYSNKAMTQVICDGAFMTPEL